ncbi:MAG TPA: hypothetical protein VGL58_03215 [Caulobacteraceae bacterium]
MAGAAGRDGAGRDRFVDRQTEILAGFLFLVVFIVFGAAAVALTGKTILRDIGIVVLTGSLGMIAGALLGFLFGLPKVAPTPNAGAAPATPTLVGPASLTPPGSGPLLSSNTNLEEVSDWLTKVVVGASLTQIGNLNTLLTAFSATIAAADKGGNPLAPFCASLTLCAGVILGFLGMYLESRIVLSRILNDVQVSLLQNLAGRLTSAITSIASSGAVTDAALAPAADDLNKAVALNPGNADLRAATVKALTLSGRGGDAATLLQTVTTKTVDDRMSEMFLDLYKPPLGYEDALKVAQSLEADPEVAARADFWFYRAAALGERLKAQLAQTPPDTAVADTRAQIIADTQRCVTIDASFKPRLRALAHPAPGALDDDLTAMAGDPAFEAAVQ